MEKTDKKLPWILAGYAHFAQHGPKGMKVEVLAREVGKNKSSFYHYFADLDIFIEFLLAYHLEQSSIIAERERQCPQMVPDLLHLLVEVKEDLLFNRQLRVHRDTPRYRKCFETSSQEVAASILSIWADYLGLGKDTYLAGLVLKLTLENFYLQITEETLNYQWLHQYMLELQRMVRAFQQRESASS